MGIGQIIQDIVSPGAVSAPTAKTCFAIPSPESRRFSDAVPLSVIDIPDTASPVVMSSDGIGRIKHVAADAIMTTGLLAPKDALTLGTGGTQSAATLDTSAYTIADGDEINISFTVTTKHIRFVATLGAATSSYSQVLIGASVSETLDNLKTMFDGLDSGKGSTYWWNDVGSNPYSPFVTVTTKTATTVVLTAVSYGTTANLYEANLLTGTWGSGSTFGTTGGTVGTTGYFAGGTDGGGDEPSTGSRRYAYAHERQGDGALSAISPTALITIEPSQNVSITGMTHSTTETDTTHVAWFRTLVSKGRYFLGQRVKRATTTDTDNISDLELSGVNKFIYDERIFRTYASGYPPKGRWLAYFDGAPWSGGAELDGPYDRGTVTTTSNSDVLTFSGGYVTNKMIGRTFRTTGADSGDEYRIMSVDESANTVVIDRDYEGTAGSGQAYEILDKRNPYALNKAEPGLHNNWPVTGEGLRGIHGRDNTGITGLAIRGESLLVGTRESIFRVTGTGLPDIRKTFSEGGFINGLAMQEVDKDLYWMASDGSIYKMPYGEGPTRLSAPVVRGTVPLGIKETTKRINTQHWRWITSHYDKTERVITWIVCLDDNSFPSHALTYSVQTETFGLSPLPQVCMKSSVNTDADEDVTMSMDLGGAIFEEGLGTNNGAYDFDAVGAITSATAKTVTCSGAAFPTAGDGLIGVPALLISKAGDFYQERIVSNTATELTFAQDLDATPASGWRVIVGGILFRAESGLFDLGIKDENWNLGPYDVSFSVGSGRLFLASAEDQGEISTPMFGDSYIDLSNTKGHGRVYLNAGSRGKKVGMYFFDPSARIHILRVELGTQVRAREKTRLG